MQSPWNVLENLPEPAAQEQFLTLLQARGVHLERIVSHGHVSPPGFWYDQPQTEWVLLVQGTATLTVGDITHELKTGDSLRIPAHARHRVDRTDTNPPTIWIALHVTDAA
ncbi:cupin domain-containing protein [Tuwongella immobilis]|uniref:Cupin type-2 domain-containing protein n=1 Tax=Tuwongella immobilis TaxID=692036 RepID=A0A6C2YI45_9BACT|nr:cupin domain-containing protein [Tuwongella immobilis]VIP00939.1 Uncharacterized protein OS=Azoarcus sp. KH32C GN=AZKH_0405 PE=4 SV=1: Cupin_2 [Tuwongella immobilis]VTR97296.1 Uncharacterized protein OS=Azoarcus sp. KH32C GN=AZKH_0405 PE=4 SV=1: Cupin_2 [Tuwongella immobilis]